MAYVPLPWFDAHLDLAYLAVGGRDMLRPLTELPRVEEDQPSITLPALEDGGVRFMLGTIFTEAGGSGPEGYPASDIERAYAVGRAQLEVYLTWRDRGLIVLDRFKSLKNQPGTGEIRGGMGVANVIPFSIEKRIAKLPRTPALHMGILMENADPIRSPNELGWWKDRGLVAVGMSWSKPSRYAGGNGTTEGLTTLGRELVREMDRLGIIHDCSHLSDRSFDDLCSATDKLLIASHSNSRTLLANADMGVANVPREVVMQRHISDPQIKEIIRRGGVIGLNLYGRFINPSATPPLRPTIAQSLAHIEHICELAGNRNHVGLGSDMDGGFGAERLPEGVDSPTGLRLLAEALSARNWPDEDIHGFMYKNWLRIFAA